MLVDSHGMRVPRAVRFADAMPVLLVIAITLAFLPSILQLRDLWAELGDAGYGHGPLLAIVSIWLLWRAGGGDVATFEGRGFWLIVMGAITAAWAGAVASSTSSIGQALWPLACWVALAAIYGAKHSRRYSLPLALMYFALPVWTPFTNLVLWPLTTKVASFVVQWLGLNAYVDRNVISIPSGQFEIIAGCSGQHFFLVASVLGLLIAHLNELRGRGYWTVVLVAMAAAMVTNWIRVVTIVVVGYYTDMQHPIVAEGHLLFGWLLFAAVIVAFSLWARWYVHRLPEQAFAAPEWSRTSRPAALAPAALLALAVLAIGPVWYAIATTIARRAADQGVDFALPVGSNVWVGPVFGESPVLPEFAGAAEERTGVYVGTESVYVFANVYTRQGQGAELVGYGNELFPESRWRLPTVEEIPTQDAGRLWRTHRDWTAEDASGRRWILRQAYVVDGRPIADEMQSKLALGLASLALRAPRSGLVVFGAPCGRDCETTAASVDAAWVTIVPSLLTNYSRPGRS